MKPSLLLGLCITSITGFSQPSFQNSIQTGFSSPLASNSVSGTHAASGIHFGNHLDLLLSGQGFRLGLGAYLGHLSALGVNSEFRKVGQAIAEKYRLASSQLNFNESSFKSTHILAGPVAQWNNSNWLLNLWAKGGYGLNEPGRYAVIYREGSIVNNVYVSQQGENKNGLAYNFGAGVRYNITEQWGLLIGANYFNTKTDQVLYNYEREKGIAPAYTTASNQFVQVSMGLHFNIGDDTPKTKAGISTSRSNIRNKKNVEQNDAPLVNDNRIKTKSNIKNDRVQSPDATDDPSTAQRIKTKSNIKNDRVQNSANNNNTDSLFFHPEKISLSTARQTQKKDFGEKVQGGLQTAGNFLTAFAYRNADGIGVSQCGAAALPGDPIPGLDVKLHCAGCASPWLGKTNADGSFSFSNIQPGIYEATIGNDKTVFEVKGEQSGNGFKVLKDGNGLCGHTSHFLYANDKSYVEVVQSREAGSGLATGRRHIGAVKYENISIKREAGSGLATGRRTHKPITVTNTDFDVDFNTIYQYEGRLYAEVITAREKGSGMATGKRMFTGDVDNDGIPESVQTLVGNDDVSNSLIVENNGGGSITARDASTGRATGRRSTSANIIEFDSDIDEAGNIIMTTREAGSGLATGRRQHSALMLKWRNNNTVRSNRTDNAIMILTGDDVNDGAGDETVTLVKDYNNYSTREAGSGLATGRRSHKPVRMNIIEAEDCDDADAAIIFENNAGQCTGKISRNILKSYFETGDKPTESQGIVVISREAGSGLATGKRMRISVSTNGNGEIVYTVREAGSGMATGRRMNSKAEESYQPWESESDEGVVSNPLYEAAGNAGDNPLFEGKDALRINGSNGKDHLVYLPQHVIIPAKNITAEETYSTVPIRWASPELNSNKARTFNQNASRSNHTRSTSVTGISAQPAEATINTTRSNIKSVSRVNCNNGICSIECVVEIDGVDYDAVVTGVLKTKHDTVKNSINNVR